jgi:hypothetical protein
VPIAGYPELPEDLARRPPETDARCAFFAGELNQCFLPVSQVRTFEHVDRHQPGRHALHVIPGYSHLDMFIGRRAAEDVFPLILAELARTS